MSAGTGRNVAFYPAAVESVIFSDVSYDMLRMAKAKWEQQERSYAAAFVTQRRGSAC